MNGDTPVIDPLSIFSLFGAQQEQQAGLTSPFDVNQSTTDSTSQNVLNAIAPTTTTAPAVTTSATTTTTPQISATPTGGMQPGQDLGVYAPSAPNLLQYDPASKYGINDITKLFKTIYGSVVSPTQQPEEAAPVDNEPVQNYSQPVGEVTAGTPTSITYEGNKLNGWATTFGLQPNTVINSDGSVDAKYYDPQDKGNGAFGYNTRNPTLVGASLPVDVLKSSIGDYTKDPAIFRAIRRGDYKVAVTNDKGQTEVMNLVDAGPANWTGNLVDLTYGATKKLGLTGKNKVDVQLIGPDGKTMAINGFHPSTLAKKPPLPAKEPETPVVKKEEAPAKETTSEKSKVLSVPSKSDIEKRAAEARRLEEERKKEEENQGKTSSTEPALVGATEES